jgi:glycosyltransferase involved in cell wall biosynthesis
MRLTIVNGFFLPVPPVGGGATEKTWFILGREFAARGHEVTSISRQWRTFPDSEMIDGVRHLRLKGSDHHRSLRRNLLRDFFWSWRVYRSLPPADIVICHAVTLPVWLGRGKPSAGRVVVMAGRMPKGQYRRYARLARVLAPSEFVRDRVAAENPRLAPSIRVTGYPIDWTLLAHRQPIAPRFLPPRSTENEVTVGFIGRLHREKGLELLAAALKQLRPRTDLPPWRLVLCGPSDIARGGSGADFHRRLIDELSQSVDVKRLHLLDPEFNERSLAALYGALDIFCYPSLAEQGETFGVAVAEAMAAGATPVVSDLACFRDFVRPGENGLVFDHRAADAPARLAESLAQAIRDGALRQKLAARAREEVRRYDFPVFAESLLADFAALTR